MVEEQRDFVRTDHDCGVCMSTFGGARLHRLAPCFHHYCAECLTEYVRTRLHDTHVTKTYFWY